MCDKSNTLQHCGTSWILNVNIKREAISTLSAFSGKHGSSAVSRVTALFQSATDGCVDFLCLPVFVWLALTFVSSLKDRCEMSIRCGWAHPSRDVRSPLSGFWGRFCVDTTWHKWYFIDGSICVVIAVSVVGGSGSFSLSSLRIVGVDGK